MKRLSQHQWGPASVAIALVALFVALGGGAYAATATIGASQIENGAVATAELHNGAVVQAKIHQHAVAWNQLTTFIQDKFATQAGPAGPQGPAGHNGTNGTNGTDGTNGTNGLNPALAVNAFGDHGWTQSGNTNCSSTITGGALQLNGSGVDPNTPQGGCGIVKGYSVALSTLTAITYQWWNQVDNGLQAPTIHISVTGALQNSKFTSGFANFVYLPAESDGLTSITPGVDFTADTFADNALWFSTGGSCQAASNTPAGCATTGPGSLSQPISLAQLMSRNPGAQIGQISLDGGGTSGATAPFQGEADSLLIGFNNGTGATRYDFGS